jgi:hypothetical protein
MAPTGTCNTEDVKDLRAHAQWPELVKAGHRRRTAREQVLELWPEGAVPADLPTEMQLALEAAESVVIEMDDSYMTLLEVITADLDSGSYGQSSS